jgi:hypothetical protein
MTYYKCKEVLTVLEADATARGAAGKNFLGQYSDRHLKEWSGIVGQYVGPAISLRCSHCHWATTPSCEE